jgi:hypothetical protein
VRDGGVADHHQVGPGERVIRGEVSLLADDPLLPERPQLLAVAGDPAGKPDVGRGVDPDGHRQRVGEQPLPGADALHDHHVGDGHLMPFGESLSHPVVALVAARLAASQRLDDARAQQRTPAELVVPAREVVGVHNGHVGVGREAGAQPRRERGLARAARAVDRDDPRLAAGRRQLADRRRQVDKAADPRVARGIAPGARDGTNRQPATGRPACARRRWYAGPATGAALACGTRKWRLRFPPRRLIAPPRSAGLVGRDGVPRASPG